MIHTVPSRCMVWHKRVVHAFISSIKCVYLQHKTCLSSIERGYLQHWTRLSPESNAFISGVERVYLRSRTCLSPESNAFISGVERSYPQSWTQLYSSSVERVYSHPQRRTRYYTLTCINILYNIDCVRLSSVTVRTRTFVSSYATNSSTEQLDGESTEALQVIPVVGQSSSLCTAWLNCYQDTPVVVSACVYIMHIEIHSTILS